MIAIIKKELADYVTSFRGFAIILMAFGLVFVAVQAARIGVTGQAAATGYIFLKLFTTSFDIAPDLLNFHTLLGLFFIPFIGIILGFDAVNNERLSGNMSRILSQPVFRDQFINAKLISSVIFMVAIVAATLMIIGGLGIFFLGVPPTTEEILRIFIYYISVIVYGIFWVGLSLLFSVLFKRAGTSLLILFSIWIFFGFFYIYLIAPAIANQIVPVTSNSSEVLLAQNASMQQTLLRLSPAYIFLESTSVLLLPFINFANISLGQMAYMVVNPIAFNNSLIISLPYFVALVGLATTVLGVGYVIFMRQELRST